MVVVVVISMEYRFYTIIHEQLLSSGVVTRRSVLLPKLRVLYLTCMNCQFLCGPFDLSASEESNPNICILEISIPNSQVELASSRAIAQSVRILDRMLSIVRRLCTRTIRS